MLGIVVAMKKEADALLSQSNVTQNFGRFGKEIFQGDFEGTPFLLVLSGIGKDNAAASAMLALTLGADTLLNFGVAGGIGENAKIGDVLQIERAAELDFDLSAINGTPVGTHDERTSPHFLLESRENTFKKGCVATADRFACGNQDDALLQELGANVREMEGAAVAHVAWTAGVPCFMFKAISDNAGENSPNEYAVNCSAALKNLAFRMKEIFKEISRG